MPKRLRPTLVTVDLGDHKECWADWCQAHRISSSAALRAAAKRLTQAAPRHEDARIAPYATIIDADERPSIRREIKLTPSEVRAIAAFAAAEGFSPGKWLIALIRARLTGSAQVGQAELEVLTRSNLQLQAIGRNLNQIARSLNVRGDSALYDIAQIEGLEGYIRDHTERVSAAITANIDRWRIE
ncbi:plasmid mobilization relaxosome protein MobC [Asticcacaulis sp. EMRT-3]|uniref:plasmid mobilization relaxosome protein MobC n=1 Tax=Asticcacaulis sp. EMRT-3 TaxID=3040349 RepID=UPI0024AF97C5|nr:plasmid mobilization relaxosome protein MobC [Asticcacaulis sp. EMRT-3]MDI7776565.1 plasmid mobilization relaxosome protein MobC [Asticcacaulis sp. EMRT-3]